MTDTPAEAFSSMPTDELLLATMKAINKDNPPYPLSELLPAVRFRFPTMPTEDLLHAFFAMWRCDPTLFSPTEIFTALRNASGQQFDNDIDKWMAWFMELPDSKLHMAKYWIKIRYDLYKSETKPRKQSEAS